MMPQLSLIVAVYNKPEVLQLVFASIARQTFRDFEVIVADDGSGPAVGEMVKDTNRLHSFPITHVWHEDHGWQKNAILNRAIRSSTTKYLVFVDGDCLLAKDFLRDHWNERERGRVLLGRRVEMGERWSRSITLEKIASGRFEHIGITGLMEGLSGKAARLEDGVRISNKLLRRLVPRIRETILGSNFSVHKTDLLAINGFDELYDGPGLGEDTDIQYRLSLIGVTGKSIRNLAIQFHVFHPRTLPSLKSVKRFEDVKKSAEAECKHGIEMVEESAG